MENFIESLVDRPWLLVLSIMAVGAVISLITLILREVFIKLDDKFDPLKRMEEEMLSKGVGGENIGGIAADVTVTEIRQHPHNTLMGYAAEFKYGVANPSGVSFVIHRAGFLNRPLEQLPPEVAEVPGELAAAGYTLRFSPPEMYQLYADKLRSFGCLPEEHITQFSLQGGIMRIELQKGERWPDVRIKELSAAGAAVARAFM